MKHYLETGEELPPLSFEWCMEVLRQEVIDSVNLLDERRGILHVRRHLAASPLFKGIPNFRDTRIAMLRAETKEELFQIFNENSPTEKVARKIKYDIYSIASLKIVLWSNAILFEHRLRKPLFKHPSYHHIQQECGEKAYNSINDIMSLNIYSSSTKQHIERYQASKQLLTAPPCHNHQNGRNADMRTWKCGRRPFAHLLGAFH